MGLRDKSAQSRRLGPSVKSAASPSSIDITPSFAPGKRGPAGTSPRTNYSRVNTDAPPVPDAGAEAQKSMAPRGAEMLPQKVAFSHEDSMAQVTERPRLQDMVKAAMASSIQKVDIAAEALRQAENLGEPMPTVEKTAASAPTREKKASADYALKLAAAVEYIVDALAKEGALTGHIAEGPPGVSQATKSERLPPHQGQGHHQPPMHPGTQKGLPTEQGATMMENTLHHAAGGSEKMMQTNYGKKSASAVALIRKTASEKAKQGSAVPFIREKLAEDAINPAKISAGAAVPPETSASGEPGGQPVGGAPQGPTGLVSSNESATNYKRNAAYANRKQDLKKYFDEPALSSETDKTLAQAFEHTPEAGTKFSSAGISTKTAAAKALIAKLAEEAGAEPNQRSA